MQHFDVIIVGAGLSGIGAAHHLSRLCPGKRYAILEARQAIGGTWDLFRYPGIRSDSDMHTLGYNFKPWRQAKAIADGPSIRAYVNEAADEYGIREHIHFGHRVVSADWSTSAGHWTVRCDRSGPEGDTSEVMLSAQVLLMCSGYYSYEEPHTPEFEGREAFRGPIVHPQHWPEDLDYRDKRVLVIGSGATAMTLVPAMAQAARHVTMVQRSPTYVVSRPYQDRIANTLRRVLPERWAYALTRRKNTALQGMIYRRSRTAPDKIKAKLLAGVRAALGPDYDVDTHFTPSYNPWDQRLCLLPEGDLFDAIKSGKASVVTDHIARFTERGILLESGRELEADIIVTATGLNLIVLGGATFSVDGRPVSFADTVTYKGMMYSDVPNLIQTFGYINASWTLRADLTAEWACKLINHMDRTGMRQATPRLAPGEETMPLRPWIDDFSAGYMRRVMHLFPKQGDRDPWRNTQDYRQDKRLVRAPLEDGRLIFENPAEPAVAEQGGGETEPVAGKRKAA